MQRLLPADTVALRGKRLLVFSEPSQAHCVRQLPRRGSFISTDRQMRKSSPREERLPPLRGKMSRSDKRGNLANAVSLRGFTKDQQTFPSQRDRFRRKQALQMPFSSTTPTCEKAILENPQIFQNCEIKINFPLNMPRVQQRRPPPVAETGRSCWGSGQQDARAAQGTMRVLGAATR